MYNGWGNRPWRKLIGWEVKIAGVDLRYIGNWVFLLGGKGTWR